MGTQHTERSVLALLIIAAAIVCFISLGDGALYYDEAIYAQVAKETAQGNHWVTLHWNGEEWFHKPPLYFWITAVLFKLFGPHELLARLPSALAGVGCVVLTYLIGKRIRDSIAGLIGGVVVITTAVFVFFARQGMTDSLLSLFVLLAVYVYLKPERPRRWSTIGIACALAVLTKGAAGLLAPAIIVVSMFIDRRWRDLKRTDFWFGTLLFVLLAGSWHAVMLFIHGQAFLTEYLFRHVIQRSASDLHQYQYGYGFYFKVLWEFAWPWILVVPFAVIAEARSQGSKVLFVQALLPLLIFSLATTKFQWYVLPAIPALAVLIGLFVRSVFDFVGPRARRLGWLTVTLLAIVGGLVTLTHCKPDPVIQAVAQLARIAAKDPGAISSCPESLEMTVLYYSDRKLCVDPVVSPLSFGGLSNCGEVEIRHFIFQNDKRPLIESRFGSIRVLNETGNVSYGEVN